MRRTVYMLLLLYVALPATVYAQANRQINGVITLSDDAIFEVATGGTIRCYVYSFYNKEDADKNIAAFKEHRITYDGVPGGDYQDAVSVKLDAMSSEAPFKVTAVNDGYIIALTNKDGYEIKPDMRKVTKNMTAPRFSINKMKVRENTGDMSKDTHELQELLVKGKAQQGTVVNTNTVEEDGKLFLRIADLPIPCRSRSNSRIIIQPYWLDGPDMGDYDVFAYADPVVFDYNEYDNTQTRRMNFDKTRNDALGYYMVTENTSAQMIVKDDSIRLINYIDTLSGHNPDESYPYPARAIVSVEDYNERYVLDTVRIDEGERTNYIKFLDFTYEKNLDVTLEDFEEKMEIRPMDSNGEAKLGFEVGKATLNPKDTMNNRILDDISRQFTDALSAEGAQIKFLQVFGYSSPEGNPQKNLDLARARADFALGEIKKSIPYSMHRAIRPSESMILGWDVVADSLQRDGLTEEAAQVREILAKYPDNLVSQGQAVQRLACYTPIIKPVYLPKLRTVKYTYTMVINRTLENWELVERFDQGRDGEFNRAHYYSLIKHYWKKRKEPETRMRLEQIAKRALTNTRRSKDDLDSEEDSLYNDGYWALAANILATSYIERDTFDLDLLRPFINRTKLVGEDGNLHYAEALRQKKNMFDFRGEPIGIIKYTNYPELIAEQIIMLLMQPGRRNMEELGELVDMIENDPACRSNDTYTKMLALANCKRGYYRASANCTEERAQRVRNEVSNISITNGVIMNIATAHADGNETARNALMEQIYDLPETSVAYYLKAIIELLRPVPDVTQAANYLAESFKMDLRKMSVANNDQQLIYNRKKIVIDAFAQWKGLMAKEVYTRTLDVEKLQRDSAYIEELKAWGQWDDMAQQEYWISKTNENHPYYWYEKAYKARFSNDAAEIASYLDKCVAINSNYLEVIRIALTADQDIINAKKYKEIVEQYYRNKKAASNAHKQKS